MSSPIELDPLAGVEPGLVQRLAQVRLAVFDVDGTLTDGRVTYIGDQEQQSFCVLDGQGLVWLRKAGIQLVWITGRGCASTERRAEELGVVQLHSRQGPKDQVLARVQAELGVEAAATLAMGDDLPDLAMAAAAEVFVAPAGARPGVRAAADLVTTAHAGAGAARELAELVLASQGAWDPRSGGPRS